jgi:hypothetical protein
MLSSSGSVAIGDIQHAAVDAQGDRVGEVLTVPAGLAGTVSGTCRACRGGRVHRAAPLPSGSLVASGRNVQVSRVGTQVALADQQTEGPLAPKRRPGPSAV